MNSLSPNSIFSQWRVVCESVEDYDTLGTICNSKNIFLLQSNVTVILLILSYLVAFPLPRQALRRTPSEGTQQEMSTGRWSSVSLSPRMWWTVCRLTLLTHLPTSPPPLKASETQLKVSDYEGISSSVCLPYSVSPFSHLFVLFWQATAPPRGTMTPWSGVSTTWPICS